MTTTHQKRDEFMARREELLLESARFYAPEQYLEARRLMPRRIVVWSFLAAILLVNVIVDEPPMDKLMAVVMAGALFVIGWEGRNHEVVYTREAAVRMLRRSGAVERLHAKPGQDAGGEPGEAAQPRPVEVSQ